VTRFVNPSPCGSCVCAAPDIPPIADVGAGQSVTLDGRVRPGPVASLDVPGLPDLYFDRAAGP
jgi:hypothetical protein